MLVMEGKDDKGKKLAEETLNLAVERVTNDNTMLYLRFCLLCWSVRRRLHALVQSSRGVTDLCGRGNVRRYWAVLSVATRLQSFQFKRCEQSNMNFWDEWYRIGIGLISGLILLLFAPARARQPHVSRYCRWRP
jgi:hypothetical protein